MTRRPSKLLRMTVAAMATVLALGACAGGDGPRNTDSKRLTLGHGAAPGNPRSDGALEFERLVEEKSNGAIDVQILGQETIGSDTQMMVSVAAGTLDMTINSQGPFAAYVPESSLIGLPFLFEDSEHAYTVIDDQEVLGFLAEKSSEKGFHLLGLWDNGMRDITNNQRPINSPEDLSGLKIRTPDDRMTIAIFGEMNANPTPMAFSELYLGLRQGAVDGQENPVVNIKSSRLQEVQEHLAVTGHKYETNPFVISKLRWDNMTEEERTIIAESAIEAQDYQRQLMGEQTDDIYAEFEEIMQVTRPDKAAFREATSSVYDDWQGQYPEFFEVITSKAAAHGGNEGGDS